MSRNVSVDSGPLKYTQRVSVGPHVFHSDEPTDVGGNDTGPTPQELLMASLGACASTTIQMYAERHQWALKGVQTTVSYARVLTENPAHCGAKPGMVDRIEIEISFAGNLSEGQKQRLLEISGKCPVHRLLVSQVQIDTRLLVDDSPHCLQKGTG
jgi:putative redox protein